MEMNFCRRCGTTLTQKDQTLFICDNGHKLYTNSAPTVGVFFVTENNELLLSVRGIEPFIGGLDAFGGFVDGTESLEQAVERELQEELGLTPDQYDKPVYFVSQSAPYPFDGEVRDILSSLFWSRLKPGVVPVPADDVAAIETVPLASVDLDKVPGEDIKFAIPLLQNILLK